MIGAARDDRQFRRGVVLGLTMAEIMLLLIFLLLLLLVAKLKEEVAARDAALAKVDSLTAIIGDQDPESGAPFDITKEYTSLKEKLAAAEKRLVAAEPVMDLVERAVAANAATPVEAAQALSDQAAVGQKILDEAQRLSPDLPPDQAVEQLVASAKLGEAVKNQSSSPGDLLESAAACKVDLQNCQGQTAFLNRQLNSQTGGRGMPPCWADVQGNIEYIYDAHLQDAGIVLIDNKLPHRAQEQAALPVGRVRLNEPLETGAFTVSVSELFRWSVEHECRFYVRLYDETGADQKPRYKALRREVEGSFYIRISG